MKHISVQLNQGQLKEITKQVRDEGGADNRFDVNLLEGKLSENKWAEMLETIEFKKDYKAWKTGNIAVEYSNNGKLSGIAATEAKYVAYILVDEKQNENAVIFLKTEIIKAMCRQYLEHPKRDIKGGDNHDSSLILLPIEELLNPKFLFGVEKEEPDVTYGSGPPKEFEWAYKCIECSLMYNAVVKNLHKNCPRCMLKGDINKMEVQ
tara:strand:- start:133 stop:753 length:621 start_codon:yes stop_codon:yes gene_type:complete